MTVFGVTIVRLLSAGGESRPAFSVTGELENIPIKSLIGRPLCSENSSNARLMFLCVDRLGPGNYRQRPLTWLHNVFSYLY